MADINEKLMNGAGLAELWGIIGKKYNGVYEHWWKCRTVAEGYTAVPKSAGAVSIAYGNTYCADSYTISEDGLFVLVNPVAAAQYDANARIGKYFINGGVSGSTMCYAPPNAKLTTVQQAGPGGVVDVGAITPVTTYACEWSTSFGEWQYLSADDREAFPDIGVVDGLEYVYLGVPFENARETVKVQTGSYEGTNTTGASNAISITFDFVPKMLVVQTPGGTAVNPYKAMIWVHGNTKSECIGSSSHSATVTLDGTTLSWYTSNAADMMNTAATYYWIAIG